MTLTERVKPVDGPTLERLITVIGDMVVDEFELSSEQVKDQLTVDLRLNCLGLAVWYKKSLGE